MKKYMFFPRISDRAVMRLLLIILALSLIPILILGRYNVPSADDFSYGEPVYHALQEGGSFLTALRTAVEVCRDTYFSWQGSFSAVFLMALQPAVFGERLYALTPFLMLGMYLAGSFSFCVCLFSRVFGLPRTFGCSVAALLSLVSIQLVPCPVQSLFWYNGSVYYTFAYGLSLIAFALCIATAQEGGWRILPLCLLSFVLGGCNYVTSLNVAILFVSLVLLLMLLRRPGWRRLLVPLAIFLISFDLNVTAPGNAVRQSFLFVTPNALWAVRHSFLEAGKSIVRYFSLPLLAGMAAMLVLLWIAAPTARFSFRLPGLVTLYSFCVYAALFTPTLYAQGQLGDGRMDDIIFYFYLLTLTLNLFYWCGWLRRRVKRRCMSGQPQLAFGIALAFGIGCCLLHIFLGHGFTSVMALGNLRSGEAKAYYETFEERLELLRNENEQSPSLPGYPCTPYLLYFDDITDDPGDWRNISVSAYFGKSKVTLS